MALGDARSTSKSYSNNSNGNSKLYDQTYYSRIRIKNNDKLSVGFTYSKGLLRVEVDEEKDNYKYDPIININFSPTKAKLLIPKLEGFIDLMKSGEKIDPDYAIGIDTGVGDTTTYIAFKVTGKKSSIPEHSFVIWKSDAKGNNDGYVEFVFNTDYNYSLTWNDVKRGEPEKDYDQFVGITTFLDVLKEFVNSSAGAIGASVWDTGRYDVNRIMKSFDPIYDKLGIERKTYNSGSARGSNDNVFRRSGNGNSSFNGMNIPQSSSRSTSKTFDEIEDMLD